MTQQRTSPFISARVARRRMPPSRVFKIIAIVLAALVVLAVLTAGGLWLYARSQLQHEDVDFGDDNGPAPLEGAINVLVVGTDSRAGLTEEELLELGTEDPGGAPLADTMILVHVSPQQPSAVMVSFPRDLKVAIPGHGPNKLNAARAFGGADLLVRTIEDYTRVPIDHYVEVDIDGFLELVDVLGGVRICLEEPLIDEYAGADIPAGCQVLAGADAAAYVRARHSDPRGDIGRIDRQQRFIKQAAKQMVSAGTLANPLRIKRLIDVIAGSVVTDPGLGTDEMVRLAWNLRDLDPATVRTMTIPGSDSTEDGVYYYVADPEGAERIFQAIREGETLPSESPPPSPSTVEPGDVRVEVLNGTGTSGLAAEVQKQLEADGFIVVGVGNAESFDVAVTELRHRPGTRDEAALLAEHLPGATLVEGTPPRGVDVTVVLGRDRVEQPAP